MSNIPELILEILSGPLDGAAITLTETAEWTCQPGSRLSFPWDEELGEPQARFTPGEAGWSLEALKAPHGTYLIGQEGKIRGQVGLEKGEILKASQTWMAVREA